MATVITNKNFKFEIKLTLSEEEARALDAIAGYGTQEFLDVFYQYLGTHYLERNEDGLRTLFLTIQNDLRQQLNQINYIRNEISNIK